MSRFAVGNVMCVLTCETGFVPAPVFVEAVLTCALRDRVGGCVSNVYGTSRSAPELEAYNFVICPEDAQS
jgi:hypothetical protein